MIVQVDRDTAGLVFMMWLVPAVLGLVVQVAFAVAVFVDASVQRRLGNGPLFVGRGVWALATLVGGVCVVAAYWAIHHSMLRPGAYPPADEADLPGEG